MVASAFTIVSFGGTGYKVIEDGYTQLVSVFVIFCADGVLAESGGYCSITNSATNFGNLHFVVLDLEESATHLTKRQSLTSLQLQLVELF